MNENENAEHQNLGAATKAVLRGEFITQISYIRKEEISNLSSPIEKLGKKSII